MDVDKDVTLAYNQEVAVPIYGPLYLYKPIGIYLNPKWFLP